MLLTLLLLACATASSDDAPDAPPPPEPALAAPGAVVVRTATGRMPVNVSCKAGERLVGGSCDSNSNTQVPMGGAPVGYREGDTLGAGWRCRSAKGIGTTAPVTAIALCQGVAPSPEG